MNNSKELFEILSRLDELNFEINVRDEKDKGRDEIRETLIPKIRHFKTIAFDKWVKKANDKQLKAESRAWQFVFDAALALGYTNKFE